MNPIAFHIGPIPVHWYGILIVTGILAAAYLSTYLAKLYKEDPELVWDALVWCVFLGVIGARLYHVLTPQPSMGDPWYYFRHPLEIVATWKGGLGIYGAIAGGALGLYIVIRRAKRNMWRWMDIVFPGVALAQAIGRWGNWINQELYGLPTNLPWGIRIDPQYRLPGLEMYERFHPLFLYESIWNLLTCLALVYVTWRYRDKLIPGIISAVYLISYSTARFFLEFIRPDTAAVGGIAVAQLVALGLVATGIVLIVWRSKTYQAPAEPTEPESAEASTEPDPEPEGKLAQAD